MDRLADGRSDQVREQGTCARCVMRHGGRHCGTRDRSDVVGDRNRRSIRHATAKARTGRATIVVGSRRRDGRRIVHRRHFVVARRGCTLPCDGLRSHAHIRERRHRAVRQQGEAQQDAQQAGQRTHGHRVTHAPAHEGSPASAGLRSGLLRVYFASGLTPLSTTSFTTTLRAFALLPEPASAATPMPSPAVTRPGCRPPWRCR